LGGGYTCAAGALGCAGGKLDFANGKLDCGGGGFDDAGGTLDGSGSRFDGAGGGLDGAGSRFDCVGSEFDGAGGGAKGRKGFASPVGEVTETCEDPPAADSPAGVLLLPRCAWAMAIQPNTTTVANATIRSKRTLITNPQLEGCVPVKRRRMAR